MPMVSALVSIFFILAFCLSISAQERQPTLVSVVHNVHTIQSKVLGENRTIVVRVPAGYVGSTEKFPVAYMLDAHGPMNSMMAGIIDLEEWAAQMPKMILVGIQNTDRLRDMTPTAATDRPGSGGLAKFTEYLETEVITFVEKNYRTQPYRMIFGHSLSGLAVVDLLVNKPDLFNAYVAASPVLHWDNDYVIKKARTVFEQKRPLKKVLFIGLGDEPPYLNGFNSFKSLLNDRKPEGLSFELQQFKQDNHASVVMPAYYAGIRKAFEGWTPKNIGALTDLEKHYKSLSARMGYDVKIPEGDLNQFGYAYLRANKNTEALEAFRKNIELYPASANAHDSYAEALEKSGKKRDAAEMYEKAYKMAEASGEAALAKSAKENHDRLKADLK